MKTYMRNCSALCEETESALAQHPCASQADAVATWQVIPGGRRCILGAVVLPGATCFQHDYN